ncbi:MAG TPA: DUF3750 domain-containing protein, partial [Polyangiaceae bacterium]
MPQPKGSLEARANESYVAVLSGEMPPPIDQVARHSWIVAHVPGETDRRFEYGGSGGSGPYDDFTGGDVMVHGVVHPKNIRETIECLERARTIARERHPDYFPIPGPNSNTFVDILIRECALGVELPATAIGRDYRGVVGVSGTETRTGVQFESVLFGLRLGLVEGVEFHFLSLVFGLHIWPPGITLPVNPGRIGFATDEHVHRDHVVDREEAASHYEERERRYGLANAWLASSAARPIDPSQAGNLEGLGTLGLTARGLYGKRAAYGFGLDFAFGAGIPASFVYSAHLFPAGFGVTFGPTGYVGVFAGVGTSGVTTLVPPALEIPIEARFEFDASRWARVGFRAVAQWNALAPERERSRLASPAFDELTF